ncbi:MAG: ATP-dependent DNA helicase RecG [Solobacterium sp.]|jgi:ATP-dependent DNA helicase RecG|nr:ATP-dependent DNA helicase RecG [Solobacterium sp.]MCH4205058.1 ATP-dependent DNA helicase RecG [Solobacterium sp.]MCH4226567.1 ATP-dependent DNA helicase RecG [Solobacterium sp.]MCH4281851.1 ATP-dependent DNA helicase RecG [Solobacterium sp.]
MELNEKRLHLTPKRIEALAHLNLHTAEELLAYYPMRYDILAVKPFEEWQLKEKVSFEAEVISTVRTWRHGRMSSSSFDVQSNDRVLKITIFNRPWAKNLAMNQIITIQGIYQGGSKVTAISYDMHALKDHPAITPVYSTKQGIQQRTIRDSVRRVYEELQNEIEDIVPDIFLRKYKLLHKAEALKRVHFPETQNDIASAYRTLKYEEFLKFFTAVAQLKNEKGNGIYKQPRIYDRKIIVQMIADLPYELTEDQKKALKDILNDMGSTKAMYRLLQGDVGCGKTIVAAIALAACKSAGYQGALLAPTEILALQHARSLHDLLDRYGIRTAVLYSGMPADEKAEIIKEIAEGTIDITVGTHAILQESVKFHDLGLVAADEQQRFGVEQRRALKQKGDQADFLLMSATPIPRTLASTLFGDMDISTIETMPAGRKEPITQYIHENSFRSVLKDVQDLLQQGHQLYVICAAVEENEEYDARNVQDTCASLQKLFSSYTVALLHGRMNSDEKQEVMNAFAADQIQVLVSTTVVEVGMNVVNATGMIIYDADRFGLSQLHQLRGRIQRGKVQGRCWLLSSSKEASVQERLNVLVRSNNGFEISYEDLRLRGPGDILGTRQSGVPDFILGNIIEDTGMINAARADAETMMRDPEDPAYAAVLEWVKRRNEKESAYVD